MVFTACGMPHNAKHTEPIQPMIFILVEPMLLMDWIHIVVQSIFLDII
jgi:hypothetical protein